MTILQRIWKTTEVERWGFNEWWTNGMGGEIRFVCAGTFLLLSPLLILALLIFFVASFFQ